MAATAFNNCLVVGLQGCHHNSPTVEPEFDVATRHGSISGTVDDSPLMRLNRLPRRVAPNQEIHIKEFDTVSRQTDLPEGRLSNDPDLASTVDDGDTTRTAANHKRRTRMTAIETNDRLDGPTLCKFIKDDLARFKVQGGVCVWAVGHATAPGLVWISRSSPLFGRRRGATRSQSLGERGHPRTMLGRRRRGRHPETRRNKRRIASENAPRSRIPHSGDAHRVVPGLAI